MKRYGSWKKSGDDTSFRGRGWGLKGGSKPLLGMKEKEYYRQGSNSCAILTEEEQMKRL